ncbi:hypothetical protein NUITMVR1_57630 (plasmid) [Raoultella ornithinolytica]|nr:hypothetical protein NUITMVR1_57630 [Raoultella ornithinolytica]
MIKGADVHPHYICSHINVAVVQHHLEENGLTGFKTFNFHCWLNTLLKYLTLKSIT